MTTQSEQREYVAPTYLLTNVREFVSSIRFRMLADGLLLQDVEAAAEQVQDWGEWGDFWMNRAAFHEGNAEATLARGYRRSAGAHFVRASLAAHYGQFLYFAYPEAKRLIAERKVELFKRAAPLLDPPAERLEIPYGKVDLPAYLRLPRGDRPAPVAIFIGGLDAAKEDAHAFLDLCLERGLAAVAFDGPGQGEAFYRGLLMDGDFHRAVSAVVDYLATRSEIDADRLGVVGRSTGGFLAAQAAALDKRVKACVAWGAMYDLAEFDAIPPLVKDGYRMVTGSRDLAEAKARMAFVNLDGLANQITCPLYVLHGGKDNITPPYNAYRLVEEAAGQTELAMYEDSIHCNHDVAFVARPAMADWLARQLGAI